MKKALLVLSAIAALALVSCGGGAGGDPDKSDPAPTSTFDGNVDLTTLAGYDEAAGGLVKDFGEAVSSYNEAFAFTLEELGLEDVSAFTKIVVLADVYDANGSKIDLASNWGSRVMLKLFASENDHVANTAIKEEYNCGVADQSIAGFTAKTDILTISAKADPVTKIVVTAITFQK